MVNLGIFTGYFLSYLILFLVFVVLVVIACMIGIRMRKAKNEKEAAEAALETPEDTCG